MQIGNLNQKYLRLFLFLIGCIGSRSLLAYITKNVNVDYLPYFGIIAFIIAISWIYLFISGARTTGPEVFGEQIWWNNIRPLHALIYLLFAYNAINKNQNSYIYLVIDVIVALIAFIVHKLF